VRELQHQVRAALRTVRCAASIERAAPPWPHAGAPGAGVATLRSLRGCHVCT
jgi:hypothetical protein